MKRSPFIVSLLMAVALLLSCQRSQPSQPPGLTTQPVSPQSKTVTGEPTPRPTTPTLPPIVPPTGLPTPDDLLTPTPAVVTPPAPTSASVPTPAPVATPIPVTPSAVNQPPQIIGGIKAVPAEVASGGKVQLQAVAQAPDGDPIALSWSQTPGQPSGQFSNLTSAALTWTAPSVTQPTTFALVVKVDDGRGGRAQGQVQIRVNPTAIPLDRQAFDLWKDPREGAFKALIPAGWEVSGGLQRVNTDPTYQLDVKKDKAHFFLQNPVPVQHWVPTQYTAMTGYREGMYVPAMGFQFFLLRYHPPRQYVSNVLLPGLQQQYPDARIVEMIDLPELAKAYRDPAATLSEAASATLASSDGGAPMKGGLTVMTNYYAGPGGSAAWVARVIGVTAPEAKFKQVTRLLQIALGSLRIEPAWLEAEIKGSAERRKIFEATANRIKEMNYFIIREESRTTAHIGGNWADALGGKLWKDPEGNPLPDPGEGFDWGRDRTGKNIMIPKFLPLQPGEERFLQ